MFFQSHKSLKKISIYLLEKFVYKWAHAIQICDVQQSTIYPIFEKSLFQSAWYHQMLRSIELATEFIWFLIGS